MVDDDLRSATILIIDDAGTAMERVFEPLFTTKPTGDGTGLGLSLSRGIIESHGGALTVRSAPNGAEALDKLDGERFDAILSDTRMPVLDGIGFSRELEHRHPELRHRVAFMTGDTLSAEKRELLARTGAPTVSKPFGLDEVQRVVPRLLAP